MLLFAADLLLGVGVGIIITISILSIGPALRDPFCRRLPATRDRKIDQSMLSDAALTFLLKKMNPEDFVSSIRYRDMKGDTLPDISGYSGINALTTYINHGGEKSRAIRRYLDLHLSSPHQIENFFKRCNSNFVGEADRELVCASAD